MTLLIFFVVFLTVVIIHELGHFSASKLGKVEVEEFAVGLPPRAFRYWRGKGSIVINGQLLEIPNNSDFPVDWRDGLNKEVTATADLVDGRLILRTIEPVKEEMTQPEPEKEEIEKNQDGVPFIYYGEKPKKASAQEEKPRKAPVRYNDTAKRGSIELRGIVSEIHTGTEYTVNWLPLGGFVRPKGENDPSVPGGLAAASPWTRLGVMLAGPAMNLIAGVLIFTLIITQTGIPDLSRVILVRVEPNSPAAEAGLLAGDLILSANGQPISSTEAIRSVVYANLDQPVVIVYERGGEQYTTTVIPSSERTVEEGATGVLLGNPVQKASLLAALPLGFRVTGMFIYQTMTLPAQLIQGTIPAEQARFIGLKGMYDFMSQAVTRDQETRQTLASQPPGTSTETPTYYTLQLIAILNISLGIFNLLPLPALDGGRIIFLLPELIFRKRVPPRVENTVHAVGIFLLLALMLYINVMDFVNPVSITLP